MNFKKRNKDRSAGASGARSEFSRLLHKANALIGEGNVEQALERLSAAASISATPAQKAKVASLVAKSQFSLGRYEAASDQYRIAQELGKRSADAQDHWLAPALGAVRSRLKAHELADAQRLADEALAEAKKRQAEYDASTNLSAQQLQAMSVARVGPRPIRYPVALTKIGITFWQEGYLEEAKHFLLKAVESTPNGASRARQVLALICLQEGLPTESEQYARESLQMGKFQAKTIASWPVLIAARAAQGKPLLDAPLFRSLRATATGSVLSRAVLSVISELRRRGDDAWNPIAARVVQQAELSDKVVTFEVAKLLLADSKRLANNPTKAFRLASQLLSDPLLSAKESIAIAKSVVEFGLLSGNLKNAHSKIQKDIQKRFGSETAAQASHAMALGAMMAKSYDFARSLLSALITSLSPGSEQWSKSLWALAKMESIVESPKVAASHFLRIAEHSGVPAQFRLQAFLYGIQESQKAEEVVDLAETEKQVTRIIADITDYRALLDAARQLALAGPRFRKILRTVAADAEAKALVAFTEASDPGQAVTILNHLARRQFYELSRLAALTAFWESLSEEKLAWLWSRSAKFWEYVALVISAYFDQDIAEKGEQMARSMLADPSVPEEGRVHLRIAYANWLRNQERSSEAFPLYQLVCEQTPSHRLASHAHYWFAVQAAKINDTSRVIASAEAVRRCFAPKPGFLWEWTLDCKAALLLRRAYGNSRSVDFRLYLPDFIERMQARLTEDLKGK